MQIVRIVAIYQSNPAKAEFFKRLAHHLAFSACVAEVKSKNIRVEGRYDFMQGALWKQNPAFHAIFLDMAKFKFEYYVRGVKTWDDRMGQDAGKILDFLTRKFDSAQSYITAEAYIQKYGFDADVANKTLSTSLAHDIFDEVAELVDAYDKQNGGRQLDVASYMLGEKNNVSDFLDFNREVTLNLHAPTYGTFSITIDELLRFPVPVF
jgi:hypothetical protein